MIFKASEDSFSASIFHEKCDSKSIIMVIGEMKNKEIVGYLRDSRKSLQEGKKDDQSFIFNMKSKMDKKEMC